MEAGANKQEAKAGGEQDPSMEEILQSIRKIIADDEEKPAENGSEVPGSEVLELTEMVMDDGAVVNVKEAAPKEKPADVLEKIDQALVPEKPVEKPAAPAAQPAVSAEALLSAEAAAASAAAFKKLHVEEPELPPAVTSPSPVFASGNTVEQMVADMLRPMLKSWLDGNLPAIVERIVEIEVKKLTK